MQVFHADSYLCEKVCVMEYFRGLETFDEMKTTRNRMVNSKEGQHSHQPGFNDFTPEQQRAIQDCVIAIRLGFCPTAEFVELKVVE